MVADRSSRLREVFDLALDRPASERSSFVDGLCSDDAALRAEVLSLLVAFDEADSFLEAPRKAGAGAAAGDDPAMGLIGKRIGHYRIEQLIAAGGMGVVYEAIQDQPRRTAAVKVIRSGIASRAALRRFAHEAEILGRLRHPGIAQVYEAGTHDTAMGRVPFFAMEYVPEPRTLVEYAETQNLSVRDRLRLFADVCDAVQHAHQHGVIHRDLKPGNILVDSAGRPKVVDFGVARATDADLQTTTAQTGMGQLLGTVPYMSPEQIEGDPQQVDTRSDVYSLGVVCYELLTGQLPYDVKGKPLTEAVRVIRERDGRPLGSVDRGLRGEVETIVAKALEKDPARRYASAAGLAADIRRYLNDEPIVAHPPSTMYQWRKFARRNKVLVGGIAAVFASLAVGVISTSVLLARALAAEQVARQESEKAQTESMTRGRTLEFLRRMLSSAAPETTRGRDLTVREVLDEAAELVDTELVGEPAAQAAVHDALGLTYRSLGEYGPAEEHLRAALALRESLYGDGDRRTAQSLGNLSLILKSRSQFSEAEALSRQALAIYRSVAGEDDPLTLIVQSRLGELLTERGQLDEAETLLESAAEGLQRAYGEEHEQSLIATEFLANLYSARGMYAQAERIQKRTLDIHLAKLGDDHPTTLTAMTNLAMSLQDQDQLDEAETLYQQVLETRRRVLPKDHPATINAMNNVAAIFYARGKRAELVSLAREILEARRRALGDNHTDTLASMANLASLLGDQGQPAEAERLYRAALKGCDPELGPAHPRTLTIASQLADLLGASGRWAEAQSLREQAFGTLTEVLGANHPATLRAQHRLASTLFFQGKFSEARPLYEEALDSCVRELGDEHKQTLSVMSSLANTLYGLGEYHEAEALMRQTLVLRTRAHGDEHPSTLSSKAVLATILTEQGKLDEAEALLVVAVAGYRRLFGDEGRQTLSSMHSLSNVQRHQGRLEEAAELERKTWTASRRTFGDRHPDTLRSLAHLAKLLGELGELDQAVSLGEQALQGRSDLLGETHQETLESMDDLAMLLKRAGDMDEGMRLLRRALEATEVQPPNNPLVRPAIQQHYGACLVELERYDEAKRLLEECYADVQAHSGETHQRTVGAIQSLIDLYEAWGRPEKAAEYRALLPPEADETAADAAP